LSTRSTRTSPTTLGDEIVHRICLRDRLVHGWRSSQLCFELKQRKLFRSWKKYQTGANAKDLLVCNEVFKSWISHTDLDCLLESTSNDQVRVEYSLEEDLLHGTIRGGRAGLVSRLRSRSEYRIVTVERDLRLGTIKLALDRLVQRLGPTQHPRSPTLQVIRTLLSHPALTVRVLGGQFRIVLESNIGLPLRNDLTEPPLLVGVKWGDHVDFWSRLLTLETDEDDSPLLVSATIQLTGSYNDAPPLLKFFRNSPITFLDILAEIPNTQVALKFGEVVCGLPIGQGLSLFNETFSPYANNNIRAIEQRVIRDSQAGLVPLVSHGQFDSMTVGELRDAAIVHHRFVLFDDQVISLERGSDVRCDWPAGLWQYIWSAGSLGGRCLLLRERDVPVRVERAATAAGRCDSNWFHLLVETMPRMLSLRESTPEDLPILVSDSIPQTGLDLIEGFMGPRREIVRMSSDRVDVGHLTVVTGNSATLDSQFLDHISCSLNTGQMRKLRDAIWESFPDEPSCPTRFKEVVAIRNSNYRRLINGKQVLKSANELGFMTLSLGTQPIAEQISIFRNLDAIALQTGAGMANLLFSRPGTRVLGLVGPNKEQWRFWADFCESLELDYRFVVGRPHGRRFKESVHQDFTIPINRFREKASVLVARRSL
jgi:capsular polysaccharide biosynthesis protein